MMACDRCSSRCSQMFNTIDGADGVRDVTLVTLKYVTQLHEHVTLIRFYAVDFHIFQCRTYHSPLKIN